MTSESLQDHQPQTIRVLTFNILSTDHASWERRLQAARTGLQALRPDILALQEPTPAIPSHPRTRWYAPGRCRSNWAGGSITS
jgi:endonuclease/exonuclease/phosphatase family metal-dependent hydrolase